MAMIVGNGGRFRLLADAGVSTLLKYQVLLGIAVLAAPTGLVLQLILTSPTWGQVSALTGIAICVLCVAAMAFVRCPKCHTLLGLSEVAREFQSSCCPKCGLDLRRKSG